MLQSDLSNCKAQHNYHNARIHNAFLQEIYCHNTAEMRSRNKRQAAMNPNALTGLFLRAPGCPISMTVAELWAPSCFWEMSQI